jgi:AcrR family transcriptional regulator
MIEAITMRFSTSKRVELAAPELGPESRDKEARIHSMIDAAISLFSEEGYEAVSTRRIAERAGCSETLIFRYFGGKRGLLLAICSKLMDEEVDSAAKTTRDFRDVREYLEYYLLQVFYLMKQHAPEIKILVAALVNDAELTADFERRHEEEVTLLAAQLRKFQDAGAIARQFDTVAIATTIEQMAFTMGFLMQILYERPQAELSAIVKTFALALSQGLHMEAATPLPDSRRQEAIRAANRIIELLKSGDTSPNNENESQ